MQDIIERIRRAFRERKEIALLKDQEIREMQNRVRQVYSSLSWKVTAPLRRLHALVNGTPGSDGEPPASQVLTPAIPDTEVENLLLQLQASLAKGPVAPLPVASPHPTPSLTEPEEEYFHRDTMLDFLVFPIIDWDFRFQRPQQIAVKLAAAGHRVFYFKTTFNRFAGEVCKEHLEIRQIDQNIFQVKLATQDPLNIYRDLVHGRRQMSDLLDSITLLKRIFAITHTVSIIDHPFWWPVARSLKNNRNVYDCMDDHSGFDNNMNITTYEPALIAEADLVVVSSDILMKNVSPLARKTIMVRNGTDFVHFNELPESDLIPRNGKPVIGYYGAIAEWFDVDLVEACIRQYPDYQFVLIGRVTNKDLPRLQAYPNVIMPGEIPYKELPKYVSHFDVCLIPFRLTKLIEATNPVKFYEYLSSGKPVVSVMLPELIPHRELCYLASDSREFIRHIDSALHESDRREARIQLARNNSWDQRSEAFLGGVKSLFPRVSILLITYNNLHLTKLCYQSLKKYTRYPDYELIIVDNCSEDGTREWLQELVPADPLVKLVLNSENRGFAGGNNQALKMATGEFVVYLNNDTVVTNHWLEALVNQMQGDPSIGLICPATNETGNEACVRIDYATLDGLQRFAYRFAEGRTGMRRRIRTVALYAAMIRRELLLEIGGLNEDYARGMFEDDELSEEVKRRGYKTVFAEDVFINHFGRASFKQMQKEEYDELFRRNKNIFEKRWGKYVTHIRGWFNNPVEIPGQ